MYHFLKITYLPSYYLIYFYCPWNIHSPQLNMKSLPLSPLKNKTVEKFKNVKKKKCKKTTINAFFSFIKQKWKTLQPTCYGTNIHYSAA